MANATIARLRVTLDDVEPAVLRRIEVPLALRLDRLHAVLQVAFGWTDSHLHQFSTGRASWGVPIPDWDDGPSDGRRATFDDMLAEAGRKRLEYLYDFGDSWTHTIEVEQCIAPEPGVAYPRLVEASGACPPEDIGGPFGYADFLDAIADPKHERHDEFVEWVDGPFDPARVDVPAIARGLDALAARWSRTPRARTKKRA